MPQVFRLGSYWVYFWTNENKPLEPVHVHIAEGKPTSNATKIWITRAGKCLLCNNNSKIPDRVLRMVLLFLRNSLFLLGTYKMQNRPVLPTPNGF